MVDSNDFQQVNTLRVLVNCFKHAGEVDKKLYDLSPCFGEIGAEISCDLSNLYETYKVCASNVIRKTYYEYI